MWLLRKIFGPCFRRPHDWRRETFGLGKLANVSFCTRCNEMKCDPVPVGGIDRSPGIWRS